MDVNLDELPIPDWGLTCPGCGYLLCGLPSHRCPECGRDLDMAAIVETWHRLREPRFTGRESPLPDFGLDCQACGRPLAGAAEWACPACGGAFDTQAFRPRTEWFEVTPQLRAGLPFQLLESILAAEYVPFMVRDDHNALGLMRWRLLVPGEFYFDFRRLVRDAQVRIAAQQDCPAAQAWRCLQCGSENPDAFDICWQCQEERTA